MRKTVLALSMCVAEIAGSSCHRLFPPSGRPFTITGIVESLEPSAMTLRHKTGPVHIVITPGTLVSRNDQPAPISDIAVGMRIVVLYQVIDGGPVATAVHLFRGRPRAE